LNVQNCASVIVGAHRVPPELPHGWHFGLPPQFLGICSVVRSGGFIAHLR
jgi:hypothetical protein